jgi:hypothetical protein
MHEKACNLLEIAIHNLTDSKRSEIHMCATQQGHVVKLNNGIFLNVYKVMELNQPVYKDGFLFGSRILEA